MKKALICIAAIVILACILTVLIITSNNTKSAICENLPESEFTCTSELHAEWSPENPSYKFKKYDRVLNYEMSFVDDSKLVITKTGHSKEIALKTEYVTEETYNDSKEYNYQVRVSIFGKPSLKITDPDTGKSANVTITVLDNRFVTEISADELYKACSFFTSSGGTFTRTQKSN